MSKETKTQTNQLVLVHNNLQKLLNEKSKALPKNFNETRFLQNCMVVLQDTKGIEQMQPQSVARTMLKGAFLGLDFFNKECYAIPYSDQLNFQTDYKGEIKLAKKYSLKRIHDIYAKLVREGDIFEEVIQHGRQKINFKPKPFNDGEIIGVFAVCLYDDGGMVYETMSKVEVYHIRDSYAKKDKNGQFSPAWRNSPGEMIKKTCLRRLCKLIEIEFDNLDQATAYHESADVEFANAEEIEPEPIKMPEPIQQPTNGNGNEVSVMNLRKVIEKLRKEKWAQVDENLGKKIDEWIAEDMKKLTPDDIDEKGGRELLTILENL